MLPVAVSSCHDLYPAKLAAKSCNRTLQTIWSNTEGGTLHGTNALNPCTVPDGHRLVIEYVSGFVFAPLSATLNTSVTMAVTDPDLGLVGAGFHVFHAIKVNTTVTEDVFAFSFPLQMMLHPKASFYFSQVVGLSVSGYLVKFKGE